MTRSFYIDNTDTLFYQTNTGIQRAQRSIFKNALLAQEDLDIKVRSVTLIGGSLFDTTNSLYVSSVILHLFKPNRFRLLIGSVWPQLKPFINRYWKGKYKFIIFFPFILGSLPMILGSYLYFMIGAIKKVSFRRNDIYFIPDSSWWREDYDYCKIAQIKKSGCLFVVFIHDIFPITHSNLQAPNENRFIEKFRNVCSHADLLVTNSFFTMKEIESYLDRIGFVENRPKIVPFKMGFDLDLVLTGSKIRTELDLIFSKKLTYISVGTIQPRKNYNFLLDAFDKIWEGNGNNISLCLIGSYGWKSEHIVDRIKSHPKYNVNLFWFNDLSDYELIYCYKHSRALIFPSIIEGFGLPLVEALSYGCSVIASDIPVFREIGGNSCLYFSLGDSSNLLEAIEKFEKGPENNLTDFRWINWRESSEQLIKLILNFCDKQSCA
jgi:glycosyltransferase involved in cell wall biosynthesis